MKKAFLFGAGKTGILAVKLLQDYDQVFFCDNDENKVGTILHGVEVKGFSELKQTYHAESKVDVYIAGYVQEIYEQCKRNDIYIAGIYNLKQNKLESYKEYCIQNQKYLQDVWIRFLMNTMCRR